METSHKTLRISCTNGAYILFHGDRNEAHGLISNTGLHVTREKIFRVITMSRNTKAPGPDQIHPETLKLLLEGSSVGALVKLFNLAHESGITPKGRL